MTTAFYVCFKKGEHDSIILKKNKPYCNDEPDLECFKVTIKELKAIGVHIPCKNKERFKRERSIRILGRPR